LNGYKRFITALKREVPDKVPIWELIVDKPIVDSFGLKSYADLAEYIDLDGVTCGENFNLEKIGPNTFKDEWGIVWKTSDVGILYPYKGPVKDFKDVTKLDIPDPDAEYRLNTLNELVDRFKYEKAIVFLGHDVFEFSHYIVGGMHNLFKMYYRYPRYAYILADKIFEYKSRVMENALKIGADVLLSGDDYADKKNSFLSPRMFKNFIYSYLKKTVDIAKKNNRLFIKHTDGRIWSILDLIIDTGIDGLHPIEPAAGMDIAKVKRKYGEKICVIGNIDCTIVLPLLSPKEVEEVVKETIAKVAPNGGYILSSSNSIHPGVKPENFKKMVEAARKYGVYPIEKKLIEKYSKRNFYENIFK